MEISDTTSKYTNYLVPETTSEWHSIEADDLLSPHTPFSFGFDSEFGAKISTTESPIATNEFTTIAPSFPAVVAQNDIEYEYYSEEEEVEDYDLNKDANSEEINEVTEQVRQRHQFQFHFDQAPRPAGTSTEASFDYEDEGATTEPPPITTQRFRDFSAFSTIQSILQTTTVPTTTTTPTTTQPRVEMFDGVIVRQIEPNLRQKTVGTVDAKDPIVVNSQRPEIVLGTFKNMVDNEFGNPLQDSSEEYYDSDEYYSDEYYSDEYYSDEYYDEEPSQKLEKLVVSTTPRPSIFSTTFRPEPITTFRPEFVSSTLRPVSNTLRPIEVSTIRFTPDEVSTPAKTQAPQVFTGSFVSTSFPSTTLISQAPPQQSQKEAKRQKRPRPSRPRQKPAEFGSRPSQQVVEAQRTKPRKPKANGRQPRPLTKSERLKVIQEKLKNLNQNGRWEKRNQRRKKLGNRVKSVPSDQPFPRAQNRSLKLENDSQQSSKPESIESKIVKSITSLFSSKLNKSESSTPKMPNNQESKSDSKRRKFGAKLLPSLLRL